MILVIGGVFQGKREFAEKRLKELGETGEILWSSGEDSWENFCRSPFCRDLPGAVKKRLKEEKESFSGEAFAEELLKTEKKVIVSEEIGSGIVPMEAFGRLWREETGRILCRLAQEAKEVWRVVGGIGIRIK